MPSAPAASPIPSPATAPCSESIEVSVEVILQGLVSGLLMGFVYALIAAGLSLIFGLMEIVNFAHGEFLMLAMFATFWAWALARLDPLTSLPIAVGRLAVGGLFIGLPQLAASVGALAAFGFLYWFITRTETGLALQATAQDRQAASLMGIDTQRMFALGWGIGAACVGAAGALLAMFFYIFPDVGATFALLAYVTVALGGFGNVPGTLVAGVLVGLIEVLGALLIAPALKYVAVFLIYLLVVLWRPQGLFGRF